MKIITSILIILTLTITSCDMLGIQGIATSSTSNAVFTVTSANIKAIGNNPGGEYEIEQDITFSGTNDWVPIGTEAKPFTGIFDGKGSTITDFQIYNNALEYQGFFGHVGAGAIIKNITFNGTSVAGDKFVGILAGKNAGTIENVHIESGTVSGNENVGGLVGYNTDTGKIINSYSTIIVNGNGGSNTNLGGLAGTNAGAITNSYATGDVNPNTSSGTTYINVGGLIGYNGYSNRISTNDSSIVQDSYATGSVNGNSSIGGLVGYNNANVKDSYAEGNAGGSSSIGGLVGYNNSNVQGSYSEGNAGGSNYIGGLVGYNNADIQDSYTTGSVTGSSNIGGLVGYNSAKVSTSYAAGEVTPATTTITIGGLIGSNSSNVKPDDVQRNYFDTVETSQANGVGGNNANQNGAIGHSTDYTTDPSNPVVRNNQGSPIEQQNGFSGWEFPSIWQWLGNGQWPILKWQPAPNP